jgi:UDP-N-acetylglucosamine 4,6-dehydratase/5-epimerase
MTTDFDGATFTITGGTGSFGSTMVKYLLTNHPKLEEVRVFSRDENKQDLMRKEIASDKVKFYIGDVRDVRSVEEVMKGVDFVFHAAALKQVPSCEFFPEQAVETNVLGSRNVIEACINSEVKSLVCLSTDKAVYPINAMGISKAMMEKFAQAPARKNTAKKTTISVTRYGNVMMSRGSVIPLFIDQITNTGKVTITDPSMTRFLMSLNDSVELVLHAFSNAQPGDLFVRKAPGCTVEVLVEALCILLDREHIKRDNIGIRHGEKIFESLLSAEELARSSESEEYFRVPMDDRTLNYKIYFEEGSNKENQKPEAYTSSSTRQLSAPEVAELIGNLPEFKKHMGGV